MYTANTMSTAIEAMGMSLALQFVDSGRASGQARRVPSRRSRDLNLLQRDHQTARHHDAGGV